MDFYAFSFLGFLVAAAPALFFLFASFAALALEGKKWTQALPYLHVDPAYWRKPQLVRQMLVHSLLLFVALFVLAFLLSYFSQLLGLSDLDRIDALLKQQPFFVLVIAVTLSPLAEELFFRGYLQEKFGLAFSTGLFSLLHFVYGSWVEVLGALLVALLLGLYVRREKNLYPCILSHALYNLVSIYVVLG